jgi:hypothetical protein
MGIGGGLNQSNTLMAPGNVNNARAATSDERGEYVMFGISARDMAVQADEETAGRSALVMVAGGPDDVQLDLVLTAPGAIEGLVTKGGQPVEGVGVNVTSQTVPSTNFLVQTGPDGRFRYDRVAADSYLVQAVGGRNPMQGVGFHTAVVKVEPGKVARVTLDMPTGATVIASVSLAGGGLVPLALVRATMGPVTATTAKGMEAEVAARGEKFSSLAAAIAGSQVRIADVPAGDVSVCVVPLPREVMGMRTVIEYLEREGESLPITCTMVRSPGSGEVPVSVTVAELPTYVPPPVEEDDATP